jgi:sialic acid synthase
MFYSDILKSIGGRMKTKYKKCKVVSELCCNHGGDIERAEEMIKMSKLCGADYVKFQKRNPIKAVPFDMHNQSHPCPIHSFGETYLDHRKNLEFTIEQHKELKKYCEKIEIGYSSSVWDEDSVMEMISLSPDFIKVPSAMNENYILMDTLFNNYNKDVHISLGMISKKSKEKLYNYLEDKKNRVVMYHTTSGYPIKFKELYLMEILELKKIFSRVGFSGHHLGISADISAYTLGAEWIERHFTLNRTAKGTDNAASLEPNGLQKLCRDLKASNNSLRYKDVDFTEDERENMDKLKIRRII